MTAPRHDDPGGRSDWFHRPRGGRKGLPGEAFLRAAQQRRAAPDVRVRAAPGLPGTPNWTPLGPFAVSGGQAAGHPVVSGRIEAIAAGPGGNRVYVGAANGGAWFSPDGGATWEVLDDFLTTPAAPVPNRAANSLSVGALAVSFGADRSADQVFVGTGEHLAGFRGLFGIGVRVSTGGGVDGSWTLEATNLAGLGCTKMAIDPDNPALLLVATTGGLFRRPAAGRANWTQVASPAFTNAAGVVSDILIAGTGGAKTYYAAFQGDRVYSSPDLATWTAVPGGPAAADGRIVLGASEVTPAVVYAFCQSRRLFRLTAGAFVVVTGVPTNVFGTAATGWYNIILAVDPGAADTIYIGGSLVWDQAPGDPVADWTLALFRGTVTVPVVGAPSFPFAAANNGPGTAGVFRENGDPTYVGRGIHPDAQSIAFSRLADNSGLDGTGVWVGCDGGLFRSTASGAIGTFTPCNTGLSTVQLTYLTSHPTLESLVLAGCQDNGTLRWRGGATWHEPQPADGGGVAIDPNNPYRMLRQNNRASLSRTLTGGATRASWTALLFPPVTSGSAAQTGAAATEGSAANSAFYSPIAVTPPGVAPTLVAKATHRVWLSADWGTTWVTQPTGTNPYVSAVPNAAQDSLGGPVMGLAFASGTVLLAATRTVVRRFTFAAGAWTLAPALPAIPGVTVGANPITSIAPAGGNTLYATVGGVGVEHCWYFDGVAWFATNLIATVDVPATTVVIDPNNPTTVFVGTDIGVYRATRAGTAHPGGWALHSQGLPESAVMHLEVHGPTRTLRAATHGRGAWEVPLDAVPTPHPELYLRMNPGDNGRRLAAADGGNDPDTPGTVLARALSPDIRVRRGIAAVPPPAFPGRLMRLTRPVRMHGEDIRTWQQAAIDRGFSFPSGADGIFGPETDTNCRQLQIRFGLVVDGIVGPITWGATFAYPTLTNATSALAVELGTPDDIDAGTGATRADSGGTNRIFVQVHSRSVHPIAPSDVVVTLLFADNTAVPLPALPAGYANRVRTRDTTAWLAGSGWQFANPGAPYAPIPRPLSASAPQVAEYLVDFATFGLGSKDVMAVALVSTATNADALTSAETSVLTLVRNERRAAAKRLILVP